MTKIEKVRPKLFAFKMAVIYHCLTVEFDVIDHRFNCRFKTSNEFIGSFMEEKWLNDKVDFSQDVKRLIKALLASGDSKFDIPLSRIGVEDMYEGRKSF